MQHFTKSQMQSARKANLYDYLMCNHLSDCIKDGNSLRPKCNHSISVKKGYAGYKDFASGETGNSVDFLVRYMGYDKFPYGKPQADEVARGSGNREYGCRRLREKLPNFSGVSFFRAGNSNSLTNAFHICVYVHLCVVPRYIASQHPWKQSQSLLQNTKETTAGHFRRSVFLLSGRIPGVHEPLWKAASLSCGRYR